MVNKIEGIKHLGILLKEELPNSVVFGVYKEYNIPVFYKVFKAYINIDITLFAVDCIGTFIKIVFMG